MLIRIQSAYARFRSRPDSSANTASARSWTLVFGENDGAIAKLRICACEALILGGGFGPPMPSLGIGVEDLRPRRREEDGRMVAMQEAEPLESGLGCDMLEIVGQGRSGSAPDTIA
jgi:hypothetical protein